MSLVQKLGLMGALGLTTLGIGQTARAQEEVYVEDILSAALKMAPAKDSKQRYALDLGASVLDKAAERKAMIKVGEAGRSVIVINSGAAGCQVVDTGSGQGNYNLPENTEIDKNGKLVPMAGCSWSISEGGKIQAVKNLANAGITVCRRWNDGNGNRIPEEGEVKWIDSPGSETLAGKVEREYADDEAEKSSVSKIWFDRLQKDVKNRKEYVVREGEEFTTILFANAKESCDGLVQIINLETGEVLKEEKAHFKAGESYRASKTRELGKVSGSVRIEYKVTGPGIQSPPTIIRLEGKQKVSFKTYSESGKTGPFEEGDKVILSAEFRNTPGGMLNTRIYSPAGVEIYSVSNFVAPGTGYKTGADKDLRTWLFERGGAGKYKVEWSLNGTTLGESEVAIAEAKK
jgi:hypothetical protein